MTSLSRFLEQVARTPSAGDPSPGPLLYGLVRLLRPDTILEIGAWKGHSTLWLARGCHENGVGRIYSLDNWSLAGGSPDAFMETLTDAGLDRYVVPVNGDSLELPWPPVIDLAFLDGNHGLPYVQRELERCVERKVQTIVLHDTTSWWGPRDLLVQVRCHDAGRHYDIAEFSIGDGMTVLQRHSNKGPVHFSEAAYPQGFIHETTHTEGTR